MGFQEFWKGRGTLGRLGILRDGANEKCHEDRRYWEKIENQRLVMHSSELRRAITRQSLYSSGHGSRYLPVVVSPIVVISCPSYTWPY